MKKLILLLFACSIAFSTLIAQTVILDFESPEKSSAFQYFGSTLENMTSSAIPNPDPTGINTSATVSDFTKPMDSEVWAGGFATSTLTPMDFISGGTVCMKVWFSNPGNVGFKLESGSQPNWITTQEVTETNQWTEICFDSNDASLEDPFTPAAGGIYNQIVLFFDFGTAFTEDQLYYFDDVVVNGGTSAPADVSFSVDMNNYSDSFTEVYVSGTFNDWADDSVLMTDDDGDGVYTATVVDITPGAHEYLFQVDKFAVKEEFNSTYLCTVTDASGQFTNRRIIVTEDTTLETVCWNSCYACGNSVKIEVNLGQGPVITVDSAGLFIAGGTGFGLPGDNSLKDDDGNGIHSIVIERELGFSSFYTFTNGACGDFSCKEQIAGQICSDPDNFDDRHMGPLQQDTIINTCFGICTTDTNCDDGGVKTVTFNVDMNTYTESFTTVYVTGNFVGWDGTAHPMSDDDGDGVYTTAVDFLPGDYEYKFELDDWAVQELFMEGDPCTVTDGSGQFTNRSLTVEDTDFGVCFHWNTCTDCISLSTSDLEFTNNLFSVQPNVIDQISNLYFNQDVQDEKQIVLYNALGEISLKVNVDRYTNQYQLNASELSSGIYYVAVATESQKQIQRIIVHH